MPVFINPGEVVFCDLLSQQDLIGLHKEKCPSKGLLTALKTLDIVNEQEIHPIPKNTGVNTHIQ